MNGWPQYVRDVPDAVKPYYSMKDELTLYEGIILKNQNIFIPEIMRKSMLNKLHTAHSGIEYTLKLARDTVFWPSMAIEIKERIKNCQVCAKFLPSQQRLTMQSHRVPEYPFQIVSMDAYSITKDGKRQQFLITADHYSDFFEIDRLKDLSAQMVIDTCKKNFSRHGIPEIVVSDGGTNFENYHFKNFSNKWNFEHKVSSPHHPEGNGKAEATVKIAKRLILKSIEGKEDLWYNILCHRNTPIKMNTSPVQRLFSRRTRGCLPVIPDQLKPKVIQNVPVDIQKKKEQIKSYVDRRARKPVLLDIGQPVLVQLQLSDKYWRPGYVADIVSDRSYVVNVEGTLYRRDLVHIRPLSLQQKDENRISLGNNTTSISSPVVVGQNIMNSMNITHNTDMSPDLHQDKEPESTRSEVYDENSSSQSQNTTVASTDTLSTSNLNSQTIVPDKPCPRNNSINRPKRDVRKPTYLNDYVT